MKFLPKDDEEIGFELAPMIDIVFQLLIFFMCASSFFVAESQLNVNLPTSVSTQKKQVVSVDVLINVLSDGTVLMNEKKYDSSESKDLPELKGILLSLSESFEDQPVIISGDWNTRHERIVDVLNVCAAANIKSVSFLIPEKTISRMRKNK
ncbi:MAG: biopolymer transporter ExbD [Candidatus Omnitrophica bacterium]|nr:biopolymer transporter ExbD [Candidatus Omnitrophota bacterium]